MNTEDKTKISYALLSVVYKLFEIDKKIRSYGTNEQLFEAEIHMIKSIKENEGIHVTGLADKLGVTKGAVSQVIMKLEKKALIRKDKDIHNQSKLVLRLTSKGEIAYIHHEKLHMEFDDLINGILSHASEENLDFLKSFLSEFEEKIDRFEGEKS